MIILIVIIIISNDEARLKSALTQDAFAQIVKADTKNKEKILQYQHSNVSSQENKPE